MNDPYSTLGISPSATDEEVKKAYRDLARKYHPDNYHDNPLADLAQEKMKEINEAYDAITRQRSSGGASSNSYSANNHRGSGYTGASEFAEVRVAINMGDITRAEKLLASASNRNAEWNFLMGSVYYRKGWFDDARSFYQRAINMDPGNSEYIQALNYLNSGSSPYRQTGYGQPANVDMCDICSAMMCANMLCRCS